MAVRGALAAARKWAACAGSKHFMQRTAVQGTPDMLTAITGEWVEGATSQSGKHPFRKSLAELKIGDQIVTESRTVTREDVEHFAEFTGDTFYAHMDADAAKANPFFEDRVAHGYLIASFAAGLFVDPDHRSGSRQLRRRQSALPDAGLFRRYAEGAADLQGDQSARKCRPLEKCAGIAGSPTRRTRSSRNMTS